MKTRGFGLIIRAECEAGILASLEKGDKYRAHRDKLAMEVTASELSRSRRHGCAAGCAPASYYNLNTLCVSPST